MGMSSPLITMLELSSPFGMYSTSPFYRSCLSRPGKQRKAIIKTVSAISKLRFVHVCGYLIGD